MSKFFPIPKKFSKEISGATKYSHFPLWAALFSSMLLMALSFSTDDPRSIVYRLGVEKVVWLGMLGVLSLLFWCIPKKIIERNKEEKKKGWSGALSAVNLTLVRCAILPACAFFMLKAASLSADQDHLEEAYNLACCYLFGKGVPKDYPKAIYYLHKLATEQNYAPAQLSLGTCYEDGEGVLQDDETAVHYFSLAAEQELAEAQFKLGFCYLTGIGVLQNDEEAAHHFSLAAEQKYAPAQNNLGNCHLLGKGVPQDDEKAAHYYRLAADQGYAVAQSSLGNCYFTGKGVPQDYEKAVYYFSLGAANSFAERQGR